MPQNINEWLTWIKNYHDQAINYDLSNVTLIAAQLQVQCFSVPVITVAGTNGKGSCIATMEAILHAHGIKVAAYTSPHMFNFNERIRINAQAVSDNDICNAMQIVQACVAANANLALSLFEYATLAALVLFKQAQPEVILLEVGMGGRLDAVNVVANQIAIITSIALDHCAYLGNTIEAIGFEKAGIVKRNGILIYAEANMPRSVAVQALELKATIYQCAKDYNYSEQQNSWGWQFGAKHYHGLSLPAFAVGNAAAALTALSLLPTLVLDSSIISKTLTRIKLVGRLQIETYSDREFVFDVAHNPAAVTWLNAKLKQSVHVGRTLVILGIVATKDSAAMLQSWDLPVHKWFICAPKTMKRATPLNKLMDIVQAAQHGIVETAQDVATALKLALAQTVSGDRIVIFGSFHTVADGLNACKRW